MLKRYFLYCRFIGLAVIFSIVFGCAGNIVKGRGAKIEPKKEKNISQVRSEVKKIKYEGSLWEENNPQSLLFYDTKARGVNDIVVVNIVESITASSSADTELKRETETNLKLSDFFSFLAPGTGIGLRDVNPNLIKASPSTATIDAKTKNDFDGSGSTNRSGSVIASISVTIVDVLDNGNFQVEGRRDIKINNEKQYLYLRGVIRPQDLSSDNTISSTLVADAQIDISGYGVISEKQRPGWFTRILDYILPF